MVFVFIFATLPVGPRYPTKRSAITLSRITAITARKC